MAHRIDRSRSTGRRSRAALGAIGVAAFVLAAASCGAPRPPAPPLVQPPTSGLAPVPHPPPAAPVEVVPDPPQGDAVWVDGTWVWQGGRWAWRSGRWVMVPPGVAFAPWTMVRSTNGTLVAEGALRDAQGRAGERAGWVTGPDDVTPAGGAFVDADLLPSPPSRQFPDAAVPLDASIPYSRGPDAGMIVVDASVRPLFDSRARIDAP